MGAHRFAVSLSGEELIEVRNDPDLLEGLDGSPLACLIAGAERIRGTAPERTLEPSVAAALLAERAPRTAWLVAGAPHFDHPYNLARRIASLDHLTAGRAGLLLGVRSRYAPHGPGRDTAWGGAGLTPGAPLDAATGLDAAKAIARLWRSWPAEAVLADRATGVYAAADRIVRVDHHGAFAIEGPLTVPTTPQGVPVLAWWAATPDDAAVGAQAGVAEMLVVPDQHARRSGTPTWVEVEICTDAARLVRRIQAATAEADASGVVLRWESATTKLRDVLEITLPALDRAGLVDVSRGGSLRERLGLPDAELAFAHAGAAFPAPQPLA